MAEDSTSSPESTSETAEKEMSFLDHLEELRKRLIRVLIAVGVAFGAAWYFHDKLTRLIMIPIWRLVNSKTGAGISFVRAFLPNISSSRAHEKMPGSERLSARVA